MKTLKGALALRYLRDEPDPVYDVVAAAEARVVEFDNDEWAAFVAAVEIAFDDKDAVPEGMRDAADRLWAETHGEAA